MAVKGFSCFISELLKKFNIYFNAIKSNIEVKNKIKMSLPSSGLYCTIGKTVVFRSFQNCIVLVQAWPLRFLYFEWLPPTIPGSHYFSDRFQLNLNSFFYAFVVTGCYSIIMVKNLNRKLLRTETIGKIQLCFRVLIGKISENMLPSSTVAFPKPPFLSSLKF